MVSKIINYFSFITLVMAFCMMVWFSYLLFYPFCVISYEKNMTHTTKQVYVAGEQLTRIIHYTKYFPIKADVVESFVDGIIYQLPLRQGDFPVGHHEFIDESVNIPDNLPSGKYYLEGNITFKVNHFRDITYKIKSNQFEVINLKEIKQSGI